MGFRFQNIILSLLVIISHSALNAQAFEIQGDVMIHGMSVDSSSEAFVVLKSDSTLGIRNLNNSVEYQIIDIVEDTITLSNGGFVVLPPDEVDDADSDPNNELQSLSINEDTLFISSTNYIVLPGLQYLSSLVPEIPIQERLDSGETPLSIFQSSVPLDSLYGKIYQGGYIFYIDSEDNLNGVEGMVAAFNDICFFDACFYFWGCTSDDPVPVI
tara:strand:- start:3208 stop:3849 length:642 start_codon:yes stop_codon:yes gene_type:complete